MHMLFNGRRRDTGATRSLTAPFKYLFWTVSGLSAFAADQEIVDRFLQASRLQRTAQRNEPVEVEITATILPSRRQSQLRALRRVSDQGEVAYDVLQASGDVGIRRHRADSAQLQIPAQGHRRSPGPEGGRFPVDAPEKEKRAVQGRTLGGRDHRHARSREKFGVGRGYQTVRDHQLEDVLKSQATVGWFGGTRQRRRLDNGRGGRRRRSGVLV